MGIPTTDERSSHDPGSARGAARLAFIAGPTASGKTQAAIAVAKALSGGAGGGAEIVNADSMQVYRDVPILAAHPTAAEQAAIPHHLFGYLSGDDACSAGRWARDAGAAIADIHARNKTAIVVGGSGLYFRALTHGLSEVPEIPTAVRAAARALFDEIGLNAFTAEVLALDPDEPARDRQRLIRAYEVIKATGTPLSAWRAAPGTPAAPPAQAKVVIAPPREQLYRRIEARFDQMVDAGGLAEAERLRAKAYPADAPVMRAVGAAELLAHLAGEISLERAVELAKMNSRRLAKRQLTWFRNQAGDWPTVATPEAATAAICDRFAA